MFRKSIDNILRPCIETEYAAMAATVTTLQTLSSTKDIANAVLNNSSAYDTPVPSMLSIGNRR